MGNRKTIERRPPWPSPAFAGEATKTWQPAALVAVGEGLSVFLRTHQAGSKPLLHPPPVKAGEGYGQTKRNAAFSLKSSPVRGGGPRSGGGVSPHR